MISRYLKWSPFLTLRPKIRDLYFLVPVLGNLILFCLLLSYNCSLCSIIFIFEWWILKVEPQLYPGRDHLIKYLISFLMAPWHLTTFFRLIPFLSLKLWASVERFLDQSRWRRWRQMKQKRTTFSAVAGFSQCQLHVTFIFNLSSYIFFQRKIKIRKGCIGRKRKLNFTSLFFNSCQASLLETRIIFIAS